MFNNYTIRFIDGMYWVCSVSLRAFGLYENPVASFKRYGNAKRYIERHS